MNTKSSGAETQPRPEPRPSERAFVIQFDTAVGASGRLRGRVEVVASGEAARFRSMRQLVGFMSGVLRRNG